MSIGLKRVGPVAIYLACTLVRREHPSLSARRASLNSCTAWYRISQVSHAEKIYQQGIVFHRSIINLSLHFHRTCALQTQRRLRGVWVVRCRGKHGSRADPSQALRWLALHLMSLHRDPLGHVSRMSRKSERPETSANADSPPSGRKPRCRFHTSHQKSSIT